MFIRIRNGKKLRLRMIERKDEIKEVKGFKEVI